MKAREKRLKELGKEGEELEKKLGKVKEEMEKLEEELEKKKEEWKKKKNRDAAALLPGPMDVSCLCNLIHHDSRADKYQLVEK